MAWRRPQLSPPCLLAGVDGANQSSQQQQAGAASVFASHLSDLVGGLANAGPERQASPTVSHTSSARSWSCFAVCPLLQLLAGRRLPTISRPQKDEKF